MNSKSFALCLIACICTFLIGWWFHNWMYQTDRTATAGTTKNFPHTTTPIDPVNTVKFSNKLSGRFILEESACAGFDFIDTNTVLWTNEIACNDPDTLKLRWLNDSIFMTRSIHKGIEDCPPKVDIYKLVSFDTNQLVLLDLWTGWNDSKDSYLTLSAK